MESRINPKCLLNRWKVIIWKDEWINKEGSLFYEYLVNPIPWPICKAHSFTMPEKYLENPFWSHKCIFYLFSGTGYFGIRTHCLILKFGCLFEVKYLYLLTVICWLVCMNEGYFRWSWDEKEMASNNRY